ncbi:hypothetical protein LCGC14_0485110 [marine sediment metagenome]|uniref:Uncharacterized protein n=1 Tax=marine sediment metagenome TaxID=412755 RepID=A0A0F9VH37_9ZZZZ
MTLQDKARRYVCTNHITHSEKVFHESDVVDDVKLLKKELRERIIFLQNQIDNGERWSDGTPRPTLTHPEYWDNEPKIEELKRFSDVIDSIFGGEK